MIRQQALAHYLDTVWAIADSKWVTQYMVGYTRRAAKSRLGEYSKIHGYQYLVVLANGLTLEDALGLERFLFEQIQGYPKNHVLYRKYEPTRRESRYYQNAGPATHLPGETSHTVYMAWHSTAVD